MARYLVTFNDSADVIDFTGFKIMTDKEIASLEELASSITWEITYYVGENGFVLSYPNGEAFLGTFSYKEITKEEFAALDKVFDGEFGFFLGEDFLNDVIDEAGELDDEDYDEEDDY